MKPIEVPAPTPEGLAELDALYRTTRDARLRTRAQMVLLTAERRMTAAAIAGIVRSGEGVEGLRDAPRPGAPPKVTTAYREELLRAVRRRPRSLDLPFSLWTLQRLADYMAEQTGIRVGDETVRCHLRAAGIVLSRPQHTISSPDPEYALKKRRSKARATGSRPAMSSTTPTSST